MEEPWFLSKMGTVSLKVNSLGPILVVTVLTAGVTTTG